MPMRVAIYARVSTDVKDKDVEEGKRRKQEVENQLHELRQFADRSGWTVVQEYVDKASGKNSNRPQFQKMFEDAAKRHFDLVLFWSLDRFTREGVIETLNHLQRLSGWGVNWRSFQESYFDSTGPFKDAVVAIMATLAKMERERISERTKSGLRRAKREGKRLGRPKAGVDLKVIRKLQGDGLSLRDLAPKTPWSLSSIMRALRTAPKLVA
jgi:DNA invertase Pin-like site-specific DNA recombinase